MLKITQTEIKDFFPTKIFQRGKNYFNQSHVLDFKKSGTDKKVKIRAEVEGSEDYNYLVNIELQHSNGGLLLKQNCTCPMRGDCKHVVASLLTYIERQTTSSPAKTKAVVKPDGSDSETLPEWLQVLNIEPAETKNTVATKSTPPSVFYLLNVVDGAGLKKRLQLKTVYAKRLQSGKIGKNYAAKNKDAYYLSDADKRIYRLIAALEQGGSGVFQLSDFDLFKRIVDTGRCFWQNTDNPPVLWGKPIQAQAAWKIEPSGDQYLRFHPQIDAPEDYMILPITPLHYMNIETGSCGLLDSGLPVDADLAVYHSPKLPPEPAKIRTLVAQLKQSPLALPLPQQLRLETEENLRPTPKIVLFNQVIEPDINHWAYRFGHEDMVPLNLPLLRLSFIYAETEVQYQDKNQYFSDFDPQSGLIKQIKRRPKLEKKALKTLKELEFYPLNDSGLQETHVLEEAHLYDFINLHEDEDEESNQHNALMQFSIEGIPQLREQGWQVEVDPDYSFNVVSPDVLDDWYADLDDSTGIDWFGLELGIHIDGEKVNLLPVLVNLLKDVQDAGDLEQLQTVPDGTLLNLRLEDKRILMLPIERIRGIINALIELLGQEPLDDDGRLQLMRLKAAQLLELEAAMGAARLRWLGGNQLLELGRKLKDFKTIEKVTVPSGLQATLRPYQQTGLDWLQFLRDYQLGGVLADDMGLGKTIQTLTHLLVEKEQGRLNKPCLIVAPTSLMANWRSEAERFAPTLRVLVLHGPDRKNHFESLNEYDLVLTTYPLLPRDKPELLKYQFYFLILDEAHNIKNPKTKATQTLHHLKAEHRLCLTGTPMENHLGELWSLFHFLTPGLLGDPSQFKQLYRHPIEREHDAHRRQVLSRRIAPFMLRRTKSEVVKDLPEKTEIIRTVDLDSEQRDLYETIRLVMHEKVRGQIASKGIARSQIIILDALLKLRQVCCHPRLVKLEAAKKAKHSAKLDLLMEMLPEMLEEGRKILLFSQFTSMLKLIDEACDKLNIRYTKLTGQTRKREEAIDAFQNGDVPLFLISLKAGGTGLNLTAADTVIHYDPWWNPAVEQQATDRAHRIGQSKKVFVYKLISKGTVEEKIQELQERKKQLAAAMLSSSTGDKKAGKLTSEDLQVLFEPL